MIRRSHASANAPPAGRRPRLAAPVSGLLFVLLVLSRAGSPAFAADVVEKYDDGKTKVKYRTDAKGLKTGPYEELFPTGKVKVRGTYTADKKSGVWTTFDEAGKTLESASYKADKLDGPYTRSFPSGKPQLKTKYRAGVLAGPVTVLNEKGKTVRKVLYPRPLSVIEKGWAALYPKDAGPPKFTEEPVLSPPYKAGTLAPESLEAALKMTKLYRFLSGLPFENMTADPALNKKAQHGAVLVHKVGSLTHTPEKPADMDEAFYKIGYAGCSESNLHQGQASIVGAVDGFMDDSDASNIEGIGHRQWVLAPGLQRVGFGYANGFTAMHVLTGTGPGAADFNFVAFPGEGYYPVSLIKPHYAWSVHLNNAKVRAGPAGSVKVTIDRLDEHYQSTEEVPAKVISVLPGQGKNWTTIVFKPELKAVERGKFWVEIEGLKTLKGVGAPLGYVIEFVDLSKVAQAEKPVTGK